MVKRFIYDSICRSESIESLSLEAESLFFRLIVTADDSGYIDGRVKTLKADCFPLRDISEDDIKKLLNELIAQDVIRVFLVLGRPFIRLTRWAVYQQPRSNRTIFSAEYAKAKQVECNDYYKNEFATDSQMLQGCNNAAQNCAEPLQGCAEPLQDCAELRAKSSQVNSIQSNSNNKRAEQSNNNINNNTSTQSIKKDKYPTLQEVRDFCSAHSLIIDADKFWRNYSAKNWKINGSEISNWQKFLLSCNEKAKADAKNQPSSIRNNFAGREYSEEFYATKDKDGIL